MTTQTLTRPRGTFTITPLAAYEGGQYVGIECKSCCNTAQNVLGHKGETMALCADCLDVDALGTW